VFTCLTRVLARMQLGAHRSGRNFERCLIKIISLRGWIPDRRTIFRCLRLSCLEVLLGIWEGRDPLEIHSDRMPDLDWTRSINAARESDKLKFRHDFLLISWRVETNVNYVASRRTVSKSNELVIVRRGSTIVYGTWNCIGHQSGTPRRSQEQ